MTNLIAAERPVDVQLEIFRRRWNQPKDFFAAQHVVPEKRKY